MELKVCSCTYNSIVTNQTAVSYSYFVLSFDLKLMMILLSYVAVRTWICYTMAKQSA